MSDSIEIDALELANGKYADRDRKIAELITEIVELNSEIEVTSKIAANFEELLVKSDREIEILQGNQNRARSEHLEQLRAIVQMISPLVNSQVGCVNSEAKGALMLAIAVIQNNIVKLDPCLTSQDGA